jgi:uncharacterized damage-inducible protein DinB
MEAQSVPTTCVIPPEALLKHWQGHRRLTRRMIEAFPEDQLFSYSVGGMRSFGELAQEMLGMAVPMVEGAVTGDWKPYEGGKAATRDELLQRWDESTEQLNSLWPRIAPERFGEHIVAFGQYPGLTYDLLLYVIDNEIHHRGQGYVYLRALGIEPPPFYERD